ncbi:MAG TPA: hypothetical protein VJR95_12800 [Rhodanobacter sp.]|nr:hypothetical protein [Rhodanobacter sp.]
MTTPNNNAPGSFEELLASVPDSMRSQPLTMGQFLNFMSLLVRVNVALKQRVAQLERQVNAKGGGHA